MEDKSKKLERSTRRTIYQPKDREVTRLESEFALWRFFNHTLASFPKSEKCIIFDDDSILSGHIGLFSKNNQKVFVAVS